MQRSSSVQPALRAARWIDALSERIGLAMAWLTLAMVLVTFAVVVLRYGFNLGWIALQESVSFLHATMFMLGAAYALRHDGHVRVDIFYRGARERTRAWVDLLGTLLLLTPTCVFIFWTSLDYVVSSWSQLESSHQTGGLPGIFLVKMLIPTMAVLLLAQGWAEAARRALYLAGRLDSPRRGQASDIPAPESTDT